jgi:DNA-binding transcriptional LysR family regulator
MRNLNDYQLFVQIVERGGFAAAGRALRLSKSTLSVRIRALEKALDARLLNRTTRQFGLTEAGEAFFAEAVDMVRRAEAAEAAVKLRTTEPSGIVRYTTAVAEAQFAMRPAVSEFLRLYPKVSLSEHATDQEIDLFAGGFDVAVRAHPGPLRDSRLIQKILGTTQWHLFASPTYLSTVKPILEPQALVDHPLLFTRRAQIDSGWRMRREGEAAEHLFQLKPRIVSDSMAGLKEMAKSGHGVMALPAYMCREEVQKGDLVRVLSDWVAGQSTLSALIPDSRGLLPAVRVFIDHLATAIPRAIRP